MKTPDQVVEILMNLAPHAEIAHHIPGRVRLKILLSGFALARKSDLKGLAKSIPGVLKMRLNIFARSMIIDYDQEKLSPQLWEDMSQLRKNPAMTAEVKERLRALWG